MRKLGVTIAGALAAALVSSAAGSLARADDAGAPPPAKMTCEHADGPGRVRCDVEARVGAGESISWGDVVIVKTPPFVSALRGRIGLQDATTHEPDVWRWALALVAHDKGTGDVEARVRLVVCKGATCFPRELPVTGHVTVGQ
ncbi:MAG TPA: hypothetical protein VMI75_26220 [Polyangiaceae bacterium]|nr:hypothetical protein [Polyangiaceae bacterium]